MKAAIHGTVFILITCFTGCVTIQSNSKQEAMPLPFKRVLVVTKMRNVPGNYAQQFARVFPAGYEVCTLALSPLSFDKPEEAIQKQARECGSEVMLTVELVKSGHYGGRYNNYPYEYNAEMVAVSTGRPFWKAIISSSPVNGEALPPGSVVKRLLKDHILEGKMPQMQASL